MNHSTFAFQLGLIPEPARRCLTQWEKEILSGLYGGETFDEIALELGVTHDEIREAIRVAIRYNLIHRGRSPYRARFTKQGRYVVETFRAERNAFEADDYRLVYTPCPICGRPRLGLACWDDECWARRKAERLPATNASLQQGELRWR
ncbi:MAG: response regulator transcription factor [Anaerolineae bacterium]|nr:response regulator transcription factor [Anaerolineae bacterium]